MDYFAGLDISMDETHGVCVLDREGVVVSARARRESTAQAVANELSESTEPLPSHRIRDGGEWRRSCFTG